MREGLYAPTLQLAKVLCRGVKPLPHPNQSSFRMPSFTYTALDPRGSEQTGSVDAADLKQAAAVLGERGLFPTKVQPARTTTGKRSAATQRFTLGRVVQPKELAVFTRQL